MKHAPTIGVEVKASLEGDDVARAMTTLGLAESDAHQQEIWFFDALDASGDPRLLTADVVLRVRRKSDDRWTSTLKLRPAVLERLDGDFAPGSDRFGDDYKVEYDWARSPTLAASMDGKPEKEEVRAVLRKPAGAADLFSEKQHRLLTEAGAPPADPFTGLRALGPVAALRWEDVATPHRLDGLRAERWTYGRGTTFLELSLRAEDLDRARERRDVLLGDLAADDLAPDPEAPPKTDAVIRDLLGEPG